MTDAQQPVLKTRRALPSGRAVLGALLITLAALGVLLATRLGEDATFQDVVVARQDLAPGTVIEAGDVATVRLRLDEEASWVISDPAEVVGNVIVGPVGRLEFLQRSNVVDGVPGTVPSGLAEVSIDVDPSRAPASLAAGELVSVLATSEIDSSDVTELIADRVVVISYDSGGDSISSGDAVLRLGLADGTIAAEIVHAAETGELSIVGVNGAPDVVLQEITQ